MLQDGESVEEPVFLGTERQSANRLVPSAAHVDAVHQHLPFRRLMESRNHVHRCRLARAVFAQKPCFQCWQLRLEANNIRYFSRCYSQMVSVLAFEP